MILNKQDDPFLDQDNCIHRLLAEYRNHGKLIVAYDFDNCVFDYYKEGIKFHQVIKLLQNLKQHNMATFICFTSCNDDRLPFVRDYCEQNNIPLDYLNETPDFIPYNGRKVYYNIFLDDRAGLLSAYQQLSTVYHQILSEKDTPIGNDGLGV